MIYGESYQFEVTAALAHELLLEDVVEGAEEVAEDEDEREERRNRHLLILN